MKLALRWLAPVSSLPGFYRGPRPGISRVRLGFQLLRVVVKKSPSHYADWAA